MCLQTAILACQKPSVGDTVVKVKKFVGPILIVFVLFWILSNPGGAGGKVNGVVDSLHTAGSNMVTFMSTVLP
jgi:hypothetical protein